MRYVMEPSGVDGLSGGKAQVSSIEIEEWAYSGTATVRGRGCRFLLSPGLMETDCPPRYRQDLLEMIFICGRRSLPAEVFDRLQLLLPARGGMAFRDLPEA